MGMVMTPLDRRQFLTTAAAGLTAAQWLSVRSVLAQEGATNAVKLVAGKDASLIVREEKPIVLETPLELLDKERVTPNKALFVRNNQDLPGANTLQAPSVAGWKIDVVGLVDQLRSITVEELLAMPQVEHEMVLQCSGNSRSLMSKAAKISGTSWDRGGMGNVRFAGVPLSAVIDKLQLRLDPAAKFVAAEGKDQPAPGKEDFEHSLPLGDVLKKSILALRLNGEPLPAIHGGPVRLITPGYFGTMQIKWLTRLRFEATETSNYNHMPRYRVPVEPIKPGDKFDYTTANSVPNWRMNVKSVILSPGQDAKVAAGRVTIRGVAFNDGEAKIDSVLVSIDRGRTWQQSELDSPASPYAWTRWQISVPAQPGPLEIWSRAIDTRGRSQPLDGTIHWNPGGYEWNGMEKISVTVG